MSTNNFKSNVFCIENFDDIAYNFKLRSPKRGKIFKGSNWNAYNRESLGSIPKKTEKIILCKNSEIKNGFLSQSRRFEDLKKNESIKFSYPGPPNYQKFNCSSSTLNYSISTNPSISSKGYGNGFVSKADRFDEGKEYYEKFYPGPGQYKIDIERKSNIRYKSLYNLKENKSLKIPEINPGPGKYNPGTLLNDSDDLKPNHYFISKFIRFKNEKLENEKNSPGPGNYFNNPQDIFLNNPDQTSFFFKKNQKNKDNILEKYLNIPKVKNYEIPGPGEYNLRREILDETKFNSIKAKPLINEHELENDREKQMEDSSNKKNVEQNIQIQLENENIYKKPITSIFVSKSPKGCYLKKNHVPGPSYYKPKLPPVKSSFNLNEDKHWI